MILYNTTYYIRPDLEASFIRWWTDYMTPAIEKSDVVSNPRLLKILSNPDPQVKAFALHVEAGDQAAVELWEKRAADVNSLLTNEFGENVLWFSTVMEDF